MEYIWLTVFQSFMIFLYLQFSLENKRKYVNLITQIIHQINLIVP